MQEQGKQASGPDQAPAVAAPPFWVQAAVSAVRTASGGRWLVGSCVLFSVYCLPWPMLFVWTAPVPWYIASDWSWFAVMLAMTAWYALAVRWMNRNHAWPG